MIGLHADRNCFVELSFLTFSFECLEFLSKVCCSDYKQMEETILSSSTLINNSLQHYSKYPGVSYAGENTLNDTALKQFFE